MIAMIPSMKLAWLISGGHQCRCGSKRSCSLLLFLLTLLLLSLPPLSYAQDASSYNTSTFKYSSDPDSVAWRDIAASVLNGAPAITDAGAFFASDTTLAEKVGEANMFLGLQQLLPGINGNIFSMGAYVQNLMNVDLRVVALSVTRDHDFVDVGELVDSDACMEIAANTTLMGPSSGSEVFCFHESYVATLGNPTTSTYEFVFPKGGLLLPAGWWIKVAGVSNLVFDQNAVDPAQLQVRMVETGSRFLHLDVRVVYARDDGMPIFAAPVGGIVSAQPNLTPLKPIYFARSPMVDRILTVHAMQNTTSYTRYVNQQMVPVNFLGAVIFASTVTQDCQNTVYVDIVHNDVVLQDMLVNEHVPGVSDEQVQLIVYHPVTLQPGDTFTIIGRVICGQPCKHDFAAYSYFDAHLDIESELRFFSEDDFNGDGVDDYYDLSLVDGNFWGEFTQQGVHNTQVVAVDNMEIPLLDILPAAIVNSTGYNFDIINEAGAMYRLYQYEDSQVFYLTYQDAVKPSVANNMYITYDIDQDNGLDIFYDARDATKKNPFTGKKKLYFGLQVSSEVAGWQRNESLGVSTRFVCQDVEADLRILRQDDCTSYLGAGTDPMSGRRAFVAYCEGGSKSSSTYTTFTLEHGADGVIGSRLLARSEYELAALSSEAPTLSLIAYEEEWI